MTEPTLTEFLLARIAEDEQAARAATPAPWVHGDRWRVAGVMFDGERCAYCQNGTDTPMWVGKRDINGRRTLAHVHSAPEPWGHGIYSEADPSGPVSVVYDTDEYGYMDDADAGHIVRHDPARVLAECEAKRRIVEAHELTADVYPVDSRSPRGYACTLCFGSGPGEPAEDLGACDTLSALAAVYADHPDFDEAWRP